MEMMKTDYHQLEWPSGYPGPGTPIPKRWERDGFYREQCLYAIHCAMNADVMHAERQRLISQLRRQRTAPTPTAKKRGRPKHGKKAKIRATGTASNSAPSVPPFD